MVTGDASVNADAPIICCTAEILANVALRRGPRGRRRRRDQRRVPLHRRPRPRLGVAGAAVGAAAGAVPLMSATLGDTDHLADDPRRAPPGAPPRSSRTQSAPCRCCTAGRSTRSHETLAGDDRHPPGARLRRPRHAGARRSSRRRPCSARASSTAPSAARSSRPCAGFRFAAGFGKTLSTLLHAGIAVHHAGMLPRYRRLVETLAQRGLLAVICGTDTLGVGINVPIRTVLFSAAHQVRRTPQPRCCAPASSTRSPDARAGPGFDTVGYVVAQAPEHEVENARIAPSSPTTPRSCASVRRKKPPEGFVNWTEATFTRLIEAAARGTARRGCGSPTRCCSTCLQRDEDTGAAFAHLVDAATSDRPRRRGACSAAPPRSGRSLLRAGVVVRLAEPTPGRTPPRARRRPAARLRPQPAAQRLRAGGPRDLLDPDAPDLRARRGQRHRGDPGGPARRAARAAVQGPRARPWPSSRRTGYDYEERVRDPRRGDVAASARRPARARPSRRRRWRTRGSSRRRCRRRRSSATCSPAP